MRSGGHVYIYVSLKLCLDIQGAIFYWYTAPIVGPVFSEELIGLIYSIGSLGSLLRVLLYQITLKDYPFCGTLLWDQVLSSLAGMLDLVLVTPLNLKMGIPDYFFAVIDNSISQMVGRLQWLPRLVLCLYFVRLTSKEHFMHCSCLYKMSGCLCLLGGVACCCEC
ncbi:hypothetical protein PR202_gb12886 [Eleusine coracana subsp. coracana]|uniref:Uncharacterized protein n=1 Tax=Eleusine coracana subsp. coracana TaxID=191504 RepID=A0AAV5ERF6_ELECO|nr:hypothetical protein PR202_gb12886 [Eleusine coracana subsp. coracana]